MGAILSAGLMLFQTVLAAAPASSAKLDPVELREVSRELKDALSQAGLAPESLTVASREGRLHLVVGLNERGVRLARRSRCLRELNLTIWAFGFRHTPDDAAASSYTLSKELTGPARVREVGRLARQLRLGSEACLAKKKSKETPPPAVVVPVRDPSAARQNFSQLAAGRRGWPFRKRLSVVGFESLIGSWFRLREGPKQKTTVPPIPILARKRERPPSRPVVQAEAPKKPSPEPSPPESRPPAPAPQIRKPLGKVVRAAPDSLLPPPSGFVPPVYTLAETQHRWSQPAGSAAPLQTGPASIPWMAPPPETDEEREEKRKKRMERIRVFLCSAPPAEAGRGAAAAMSRGVRCRRTPRHGR